MGEADLLSRLVVCPGDLPHLDGGSTVGREGTGQFGKYRNGLPEVGGYRWKWPDPGQNKELAPDFKGVLCSLALII